MNSKEVIDIIQNLGAPVVYSLLALWFIKFQFVKSDEAAERGRQERQRIIDDFTKRDSDNDKRSFELAQQSNDAINKISASLEANTKSMDNLLSKITQK